MSGVLQKWKRTVQSEKSITTTARKIHSPVTIIHLLCIHSFDIKLSGYKKLFPSNLANKIKPYLLGYVCNVSFSCVSKSVVVEYVWMFVCTQETWTPQKF